MAGGGRAPGAVTAARVTALAAAFAILVLVGVTGESAARPGLGPRGWAPGALPVHLSSATVTALLWVAYLLGAAGVALALWRPPAVARRPARWATVGALAVLVLLTAPFGSADHTNYAAYGRIAAQGGDPYAVSPALWHGGGDPVTSAVEPPWRTTPSVYGPLATAVQALTSVVGGDNLRQTVWLWQVVVVGCFLATRWMLLRLAETERSRSRVDVLWTMNPVVVGVLVCGAHVDVLSTCAVVGALLLARRSPLLAGLAVGAAVSTKITYGVVAVGLVWAWGRTRPGELAGRLARALVGALVVILPLYVWAGPHAFRQLRNASGTSSLATAWSVVVQALRHVLPEAAVTTIVFVLAAVAMIALAGLLGLLAMVDRRGPGGVGPLAREADPVPVATVVTFVLSTAYVIAAPYSLPWYDGLTWALLPLLVPSALDGVLLGRFVVMALAYVPGRVVGMSAGVEGFSLGFRRSWAPWAGWLTWLGVAVLARRNRRGRRPAAELR